MTFEVERVRDVSTMRAANLLFNEVFAEEAYHGPAPGEAHLARLVADDKFVAFVARSDGHMIGAIAGYELVKFEAERSEFYVYDLAVREEFRRQGVATELIEATKRVARERGGWVVFIQADPVDKPAVALYDKLGTREEVYHFDISVDADR